MLGSLIRQVTQKGIWGMVSCRQQNLPETNWSRTKKSFPWTLHRCTTSQMHKSGHPQKNLPIHTWNGWWKESGKVKAVGPYVAGIPDEWSGSVDMNDASADACASGSPMLPPIQTCADEEPTFCGMEKLGKLADVAFTPKAVPASFPGFVAVPVRGPCRWCTPCETNKGEMFIPFRQHITCTHEHLFRFKNSEIILTKQAAPLKLVLCGGIWMTRKLFLYDVQYVLYSKLYTNIVQLVWEWFIRLSYILYSTTRAVQFIQLAYHVQSTRPNTYKFI